MARFEFRSSDLTFHLLRDTVVKLNSHEIINFLMKRDYPFLFPQGKKPIFFGDFVANPSRFQNDYSEELTEILCGTDELVEDTYLGRTGSFTDLAREGAGLSLRYINDVGCEKPHCMTPEQRMEENDEEPILPKIKGPQLILFNALEQPFQARPGSPFQPYKKPWQVPDSCKVNKDMVMPPPIPKRMRITSTVKTDMAMVEQLTISQWKSVQNDSTDEVLIEPAKTVSTVQPQQILGNMTLLKPEKPPVPVSDICVQVETIELIQPFEIVKTSSVEVVQVCTGPSDLRIELPVIRNDAETESAVQPQQILGNISILKPEKPPVPISDICVQVESTEFIEPLEIFKSSSAEVVQVCTEPSDLRIELPVIRNDAVTVHQGKTILSTAKVDNATVNIPRLTECKRIPSLAELSSKCLDKVNNNEAIDNKAFVPAVPYDVPKLATLAKANLPNRHIPRLTELVQKYIMENSLNKSDAAEIMSTSKVPKLSILAKAKVPQRQIPSLAELAQKCLDETHHVSDAIHCNNGFLEKNEILEAENKPEKRPSRFKRFRRGCARVFRRIFCRSRGKKDRGGCEAEVTEPMEK